MEILKTEKQKATTRKPRDRRVSQIKLSNLRDPNNACKADNRILTVGLELAFNGGILFKCKYFLNDIPRHEPRFRASSSSTVRIRILYIALVMEGIEKNNILIWKIRKRGTKLCRVDGKPYRFGNVVKSGALSQRYGYEYRVNWDNGVHQHIFVLLLSDFLLISCWR